MYCTALAFSLKTISAVTLCTCKHSQSYQAERDAILSLEKTISIIPPHSLAILTIYRLEKETEDYKSCESCCKQIIRIMPLEGSI